MESTGALSSEFIDNMRVLFNIIAEKDRGLVRFADIESRWQEGLGLPKGTVQECLRNVTNAKGELSFERFCVGLKICLLKKETIKLTQQPPPKPPRLDIEKFSTGARVLSEFGVTLPQSKRKEPRRHTLQHGIDYNRLRKLKQLEQEKNLLRDAMVTVTQTQCWLNHKIHLVNEEIRQIGRSSELLLENNSQIDRDRLELKRAQAAAAKRCLISMVRNWGAYAETESNVLVELNLETQWNNHPLNQSIPRQMNSY